MLPPHLPPPTCSIARHQQLQRLKVLGVATFFGLWAGLTGASILVGWIWPSLGGGDTWVVTRDPVNLNNGQISDQTKARLAEKIFTIYKRSNTIGTAQYFNNIDKLATGVMGVSSGWIVAYIPSFDGHFKDWAVLSDNGIAYKVGKVLEDKRSGFLYIRLDNQNNNGEQFKVSIFDTSADRFNTVFVYQDGNWFSSAVLGRSGSLLGDSHVDSLPALGYVLSGNFKVGSLVSDVAGNILGFVFSENLVIPVTPVSSMLGGIDVREKITYPSLGVEGWYGEEKTLVINREVVSGFVVSRTISTKTSLKRGDIILEINGHPATFENLWYNINGQQKAGLKVLRGGKEIELETAIVQI